METTMEERVLAALGERGQSTANELALHLGLKTSSRVQIALSSLIVKRRVQRVATNTSLGVPSHYRLTASRLAATAK